MPIDYSKYPPDWPETRARILERAGHKCENCALPNHAIVLSVKTDTGTQWFTDTLVLGPMKLAEVKEKCKLVKVVLTIAHLDHDEENHDVKDDRLAAWCQLCHLRYDKEEKAKRRKRNEHNDEREENTGCRGHTG